jgi:hypothetical protein
MGPTSSYAPSPNVLWTTMRTPPSAEGPSFLMVPSIKALARHDARGGGTPSSNGWGECVREDGHHGSLASAAGMCAVTPRPLSARSLSGARGIWFSLPCLHQLVRWYGFVQYLLGVVRHGVAKDEVHRAADEDRRHRLLRHHQRRARDVRNRGDE